jgi:hypothetical protein
MNPMVLYWRNPNWSVERYAEYLDLPGVIFAEESEAFILGLEIVDELHIDCLHGTPSDEFWRELRSKYFKILVTISGFRWKPAGKVDVLVGWGVEPLFACLDAGFTWLTSSGFGKVEIKLVL